VRQVVQAQKQINGMADQKARGEFLKGVGTQATSFLVITHTMHQFLSFLYT
jgi:hypothetical protein